MAKAKSDKTKGASNDAETSELPSTEVKSPSKLGAVFVPLVAFLAAGGASFVLSQSPAAPAPAPSADVQPVKTSQWTPPKAKKTVTIEPVLVSLGEPERILKLGLALEMMDADADPTSPQLRDAFTGYLRTIGPEAIGNPGFHAQLKRQLLHRARVVMGPEAVTDVLITDFMITR